MKDDLATHGGVSESDGHYHLFLAAPGSSFQGKLEDMYIRDMARQGQEWKYGGENHGFATHGYLETLDDLYFNEINDKVMLESVVTEVNTAGPIPYAVVGGDKHYGNSQNLRVRVSNNGSKIWHSYLQGSVSGVGSVTHAVLRIYSNDLTMDIEVFEAAGSFDEGSITWNNAPGTTGGALDSLSVTSGAWFEFDVTSLITGDGTYSLVLIGEGTESGTEFRSSENANNPVLRVTHE